MTRRKTPKTFVQLRPRIRALLYGFFYFYKTSNPPLTCVVKYQTVFAMTTKRFYSTHLERSDVIFFAISRLYNLILASTWNILRLSDGWPLVNFFILSIYGCHRLCDYTHRCQELKSLANARRFFGFICSLLNVKKLFPVHISALLWIYPRG